MKLYHYTNGTKILSILNDGQIKTTPEVTKPREKAIAWLSANPQWEVTANKATYDENNKTRLMTQEETERVTQGLYRFAFEQENLQQSVKVAQWPKLSVVAKIPDNLKKYMLKSAKNAKAKPQEWFGATEPLPIDVATLEKLEQGKWVAVDRETLMENPIAAQAQSAFMTKEKALSSDDWKGI